MNKAPSKDGPKSQQDGSTGKDACHQAWWQDSIPEPYVVKAECQSIQAVLWPSREYHGMCLFVCICTCTQTQRKYTNVVYKHDSWCFNCFLVSTHLVELFYIQILWKLVLRRIDLTTPPVSYSSFPPVKSNSMFLMVVIYISFLATDVSGIHSLWIRQLGLPYYWCIYSERLLDRGMLECRLRELLKK